MLQHEPSRDAQLTIDVDHLDDELTVRERAPSMRSIAQKLCKDLARTDGPRTQASMEYTVEIYA